MTGGITRTNGPPITVVSGMHRSGTSLVTGCLVAGGWFAGAEADLIPADANNPSGYFEHGRLNQIADGILAALDADWAASPPPDDVAARGAAHAGDLEDVVRRLLDDADGRPLVVKEPRLSTLWPLWPAHLSDAVHVLPLRHPLSVARSLVTRDGLPVPVGLALWEHQLRSALHWLNGRRVLVVRYEDIVAGRATAWTWLEEFVEGACLAAAVDADAVRGASLVRADLDRHPVPADDDAELARLDAGQRTLREWLRDLPGHHARLEVPEDLLTGRDCALDTLVQMRAHRLPADEALTHVRRAAAGERSRLIVVRERANAELAAHRLVLAQRDTTIAEREATIAEQADILAAQRESLAHAHADLARTRTECDRLGAELETVLGEAEALRADLRGSEAALVVAEAARHHLGVQLCAVLQRLDAIEASRSHRLVTRAARLWRRGVRLLHPRGSEPRIPRRAAA